ncbi:MAG TPA: HlyD family efflux transporter periplasmic adaptor subunit [Burkholderiales bacterium]|nr:HlyD family efflux transporter periplasmic adaptor subunit [Burkholderiales bacterium]
MKRAAVLALIVVAIAGGGWYWVQSRNGDAELRYRVAKVERGALAAVVVASGTLNAVTTVQVGSQISGQVKEIFADFNTAVKKDQVIAQIDPSTFELRVNQARADLDSASGAVEVARAGLVAQQAEVARVKFTLVDAQRDVERKKQLVDKKFISPAELEKAVSVFDTTREQLKAVQAQIKVNEAQVASARAAVKQRESLLKQAQVDLERTIIRAPVDGTVILRNVDAGQTVAASLQAPVLFTIAQDLRDMQVEAAIDEADVGRLRVGMAASFAVDAFPRRNFGGEIRQIRKSPLNVQNVVSYTVVISAGNPDLALLPGMTANVRIAVENRASALKVPNAALRFRPPGATADAKAPSDAPAPQQQGGQAAQEFRNRIQQELKPSDAQRAQLDEIFSESRQKFARVRDMKGDGNRRKEAERVRSETNARIAEILTPEQRPAWERLLSEAGGRGPSSSGRVYVLENAEPKPVDVRLGLSDGMSTEVLGGINENQEVIIGTADARASQPAAGGGLPRARFF